METNIESLSSQFSALRTTSHVASTLDHQQAKSTFILPSMSSCPMATDGYSHLLVSHHQTLILFHLPNFEILSTISLMPTIDSPISDICFYSVSNCFLVSSSSTVYSLSSKGQLEAFHKFSNTIWSMAQTASCIFICYLFGFSIEQWSFSGDGGALMNTWLKASLLEPLDRGINCIRTFNQCLGMTIKENDFSWRIDIFDVQTMKKIRRGLVIQQGNNLRNWIGLLHPVDEFQWLFADGDQGLILMDHTDQHTSQQSRIKSVACNVCLIRDLSTNDYCSIVVQSYDALHLYDFQ